MLNKKDFLKYASTLAFPIMIQNLISTLVNIADTVMLGYVSQTAMSASSLANQYTFVLFCIYYGMATGTSVLCAQYWGKGDKKDCRKDSRLSRAMHLNYLSDIFPYLLFHANYGYEDFLQINPDTIAAGSEVFEGTFIFTYVYGILSGFLECPSKYRKDNAAFCYIHCLPLCQCTL